MKSTKAELKNPAKAGQASARIATQQGTEDDWASFSQLAPLVLTVREITTLAVGCFSRHSICVSIIISFACIPFS